MRSSAALSLLVVAGLTACNHGDDVFVSEAPEHVPTFTADRTSSQGGDVYLTGVGEANHRLRLTVHQGFTSTPQIMNLLLRVDPAIVPTVPRYASSGFCGNVTVGLQATGTPGEWRLARGHDQEGGACTEHCPTVPNVVAEFTLELVGASTTRVELLPSDGSEFCGCDGCSSSLALFGGTVTNPM